MEPTNEFDALCDFAVRYKKEDFMLGRLEANKLYFFLHIATEKFGMKKLSDIYLSVYYSSQH
jgi:hypothetical protein